MKTITYNNMKSILVKIVFILGLIFTGFANAAIDNIIIDERINDVYYLNGKLITKRDAKKSLDLIEDIILNDTYKGDKLAKKRETNFDLLYNSSYGFYVDLLEAFNQKKADHQYFWITVEAVVTIAGKTSTIGIATDTAKGKVLDMIAKEMLNTAKELAITGGLEAVDQEWLKNIISSIEDALKKRTGSYTWSMINAISDTLQEMDLNVQFEALSNGIASGHQAIIVAHAEGNFFINDLDDRFDKYNKSWMKQHIKSISISNPSNKVSFGGSHITYDNDPIIKWPDRVGPDTLNPLRYRRFYLRYDYNGTLSDDDVSDIIDYVKAMNMPDECKVSLGFYFKDDIADICYNSANIALFDIPNSEFHSFEYYMRENLVSDTGSVRQNPSRKYITDFLSNSIVSFRTAPSQWKVIEKQESEIKTCEDKLLKTKHMYDDSINDIDKVYPFDKTGKVYPVNGEYVKGSIDGVEIESHKDKDVCYKLIDENNETVGKIDGIAIKQTRLVIVEGASIRHDFYDYIKFRDYVAQIGGATLLEISENWYIYGRNHDDVNRTYPIYASPLNFDFDINESHLFITLLGKCTPVFRIPLTMLIANNGHIADLKNNEKGEFTIYSNFKPSNWRTGNKGVLSTFIDYRDICENMSWIYD
ncbi:MAG: hypothetical protein LBH45_06655 [Campylobacteraceae bacterium]|jgi:hypothetical protein|nr:hypothetical protein [Campylobacteraceae bacterium]